MKPSPTKSRLAGVELTRGLAAYGVIVIHVGMISTVEPSASVEAFQGFLSLTCVPFFLAVSFYFAALTSSKTEALPLWLKRRASRLLIPYALWTVIYTALQVVQALMHPDRARNLATVFSDPIDRLFFGSSGIALYFLPLLFIGLVTMRLLTPLFARRSTALLVIGLLVSLIPWGLTYSGHGFAFDVTLWPRYSPMRFVDKVSEFTLHCLPFIFLGWICARYAAALTSSARRRIAVAIAALLLLVLLPAVPDSFFGFAVFLLAMAVSVKDISWTEIVGRYSFGIYLVHQVILEGIKLGVHNHPLPMGLATVLPITLATFAMAFLLVYLAERFGGQPGRLLMALPDRVPPGR